MSLNKPMHLIAFAIATGLFAYLASALWCALFIVSLPMDEDAITNSVEIVSGEDDWGNLRTRWYPTEFKNQLEKMKYYHNIEMQD